MSVAGQVENQDRNRYEASITRDLSSSDGYILTITQSNLPGYRSQEVTEVTKYTSAHDLISHVGRQRLWRNVQQYVGFAGTLGGLLSAGYAILSNTPEDPILRGALSVTAGAVFFVSGMSAAIHAGYELDKLNPVRRAIKDSHFKTMREGFAVD